MRSYELGASTYRVLLEIFRAPRLGETRIISKKGQSGFKRTIGSYQESAPNPYFRYNLDFVIARRNYTMSAHRNILTQCLRVSLVVLVDQERPATHWVLTAQKNLKLKARASARIG